MARTREALTEEGICPPAPTKGTWINPLKHSLPFLYQERSYTIDASEGMTMVGPSMRVKILDKADPNRYDQQWFIDQMQARYDRDLELIDKLTQKLREQQETGGGA